MKDTCLLRNQRTHIGCLQQQLQMKCLHHNKTLSICLYITFMFMFVSRRTTLSKVTQVVDLRVSSSSRFLRCFVVSITCEGITLFHLSLSEHGSVRWMVCGDNEMCACVHETRLKPQEVRCVSGRQHLSSSPATFTPLACGSLSVCLRCNYFVFFSLSE